MIAATLLGALLLWQADPELRDLLLFGSDDVVVRLTSPEGQPQRLDVIATGAPVSDVFSRIARTIGRQLTIAEGEAELRSIRPLEAHLRDRPLEDVLNWMAASAGLIVRLGREKLRLEADVPGDSTIVSLLERARNQYLLALVRHPTHVEAPRLRFEIANIHYALGEYELAADQYLNLIQLHPTFGDLPMAHFRASHAFRQLGNEVQAGRQLSQLIEDFPDGPLAAPAYVELAHSLHLRGEDRKAEYALRHVTERMKKQLAPVTLLRAAWLLCESGSYERSATAFDEALEAASAAADKNMQAEALAGLTESYAGLGNWPRVIDIVARFVKTIHESPHAARIFFQLARAHRELEDPLTTLLAVRRAREFAPIEEITERLNLLEGEVYADTGMLAHALPLLFQASQSMDPEVAVPALVLHAALSIEAGRLDKARRSYERLEGFAGHELEAGVGRARVALLQRNRPYCLQLVNELLPRVTSPEQRQQLVSLATQIWTESPELARGEPLAEAANTGATEEEQP